MLIKYFDTLSTPSRSYDHSEAILLPGPIEQRNQAVVEQVEKIDQGAIPFPDSGKEKGGVAAGEHTGGTGKSHEGDHHAWPYTVPLDPVDVAWRKCNGRFHGEPDRFVVRIDKTAHGLPSLGKPQQQPHRLEKVEASGVLS